MGQIQNRFRLFSEVIIGKVAKRSSFGRFPSDALVLSYCSSAVKTNNYPRWPFCDLKNQKLYKVTFTENQHKNFDMYNSMPSGKFFLVNQK